MKIHLGLPTSDTAEVGRLKIKPICRWVIVIFKTNIKTSLKLLKASPNHLMTYNGDYARAALYQITVLHKKLNQMK